MSEEKYGIKESKEALVGGFELALYLTERLKDGVGMDDVTDLMTKLMADADFKKKMEDAYEGISKIKDEFSDLSLQEGFELAGVGMDYTLKFVNLFKK